MNRKSLSSEWLDMAEMDLNAAEYLLGMRPIPIEIICYHCEQAAEKLLKGALVHFDIEPPKTHDLVQLCKLCCNEDTHFEVLVDACVDLTPYGVQVRYPSNLELDESDTHCALRQCRIIHKFIQPLLKQNEVQDMDAETAQSFEQSM